MMPIVISLAESRRSPGTSSTPLRRPHVCIHGCTCDVKDLMTFLIVRLEAHNMDWKVLTFEESPKDVLSSNNENKLTVVILEEFLINRVALPVI